jgi:hypothetical protein
MSPKLDVFDVRFLKERSTSALKFGIFQRSPGTAEGGRLIAKFASVELAERFVGVLPSLPPRIVSRGIQRPAMTLLRGGKR